MTERVLRPDQALKSLIPFLSAFIFLLLGAVPGHSTLNAALVPSFLFIALYYWSIHRPDLMPAWLVLMFGLAEDSLTGSIFGLHAFLFLIAYYILLSQRRFFVGGSFLMLWWGFAITSFLIFACEWIFSSLLGGTFMPFLPALGRTLSSIACFPLLAWAFIKLHRIFLHSPL